MTRTVRLQVAVVVTAVWIGAALITVGVVAPGAFAVLPSRTMAGALVGRVLPSLFVGGMIAGLAVATLLAVPPRVAGPSRNAFIAALMAAAACGIAQFVIAPKIDRVRAQISGPVDGLAAGDPRRVAFGLLHGYSVAGLALAIACAVACLILLSVANRPSR